MEKCLVLYEALIQYCVMFAIDSESFWGVSKSHNVVLAAQKLMRGISVLMAS